MSGSTSRQRQIMSRPMFMSVRRIVKVAQCCTRDCDSHPWYLHPDNRFGASLTPDSRSSDVGFCLGIFSRSTPTLPRGPPHSHRSSLHSFRTVPLFLTLKFSALNMFPPSQSTNLDIEALSGICG